MANKKNINQKILLLACISVVAKFEGDYTLQAFVSKFQKASSASPDQNALWLWEIEIFEEF